MTYFLRELTRALRSRRFGIVLVFQSILLVVGLSAIYGFARRVPGAPVGWRNAYSAWLMSLDAFVLFAPLAAPLTYADAIIEERRQGFGRYVLLRLPYRTYLAVKVLVNAIAGGLSLTVPSALFFLGVLMYFGHTLPPMHSSPSVPLPCVSGTYLCDHLFPTHPNLYIAARMGWMGAFGMVYATLGMAFSAFSNNRYVALVGPLVVHYLVVYLLEFVGLSRFSPFYVLDPAAIGGSTAWTMAIPLLIMGSVSLAILIGGLHKEHPFVF